MSRHTPKTFAEARAITDPIRRADALLKLSQEAEDRRESDKLKKKSYGPGIFGPDLDTKTWEQVPTTQNDDGETVWETVDGPCFGDCYVVAFGFIGNVGMATYYVIDATDEAEAMNAAAAIAHGRGDNGVYTRAEAIDYHDAGDDGEPNDAIPLDFDDMFADPDTRVWKLPDTPPQATKAARPAMRKAGRGNNIGVVHYTEDGNVFWTVTMNGLSESAAFPDVDKYNGAGDGEKRARRQAEKLYAQANSPKRMFERDGDTGEETDIKSDDGTGKAMRPAMRKRGYASRDQIVASMKWGDWDSKGKTRIGTSNLVPGAKFIILKEPIQGYKYQLLVDYNGEKSQIDKNDNPDKLMYHPPAHWIEGNMPDREPDANDAGDQQAYIASARPAMRKSYGAISNISRVVKSAQGFFDQLMADDYFSKTYSEDELADAAIEIAMRKTGTGPKTKKIVRETGNMFI